MKKHLLAAGFGCCVLMSLAAQAAATPAIIGKADEASTVSVEVALPLRNVDELKALLVQLHDPASPQYHQWLTPAQFGLRFGPDGATVAKVTKALQARGFEVTTHTRSLHLRGTVNLVERSFGAHLNLVHTDNNAKHLRVMADRQPRLPAELAAVGATLMSFGPQEAHVMARQATGKINPQNRYGADGGYWYDDLKQAYSYPAWNTMVTVGGTSQRLDGTGATIGVLMSSDYLPADVQAVFDNEGFATTTGLPDPTLAGDVAVDGGAGLYGGAFAEVSIDTQSEITNAPGANVVLYDIPDLSDGSIFAGYVTIVEYNQVDLVSASFGGCELGYFPAYNGGVNYTGVLKALDELFLQGNAQGISFLASSGDSAGKECPNAGYLYGKPGVFVKGISYPAADPNVTAVGGTNLQTVTIPGSLDSAYASENAWSDPEIPYNLYGLGNVSGGVWGAGSGSSALWAAPSYQSLVTTNDTKWRTVPDVGMMVGGCPGGISKINPKTHFCDGGNKPNNGDGNADRSYGVFSIAAGQGGGFYGYIGTSLSSPEFAGAMALLIEQKGRMGNLNTYLYQKAAEQAKSGKADEYYHTQTPGFNGVAQSDFSPTYDLSTGVGTPIVKNLVGARSAQPAGLPQTITNP